MSPNEISTVGNNARVIEIRPAHVESLFQSFDPSPTARRALSTEAVTYVVDRVTDPSSNPIEQLRIVLPASEAGSCGAVQEAFQRHFAAAASRRKCLLQKHFRSGWLLLLKGVGLALILVTLSQVIAAVSDSALLARIADGISIVVWVILWRPVDTLIYDWRPLREDLRMYQRLADIEIVCGTQS